VFSLIIVATIVSATLWRRSPDAVAEAGPPDAAAAMNLNAVLQMTPEYVMMSRYAYGSQEYQLVYRKARLRVVAAAQWVGREMGLCVVVCSPSTDLPDVTGLVTARLISPSLDFCPVAKLTDRPFTGTVITVPV
jgi:hypothetical protein